MLSDTLRAGAESRVFKIILFLIILSFIFTGVGGYLIPRLNTDPVEVGEYKITSQEWNNQYNQQAQMLQRTYGAQAVTMLENPEYVREFKTQILENIIDNVAFNTAVFDANVRIGDSQVKDVIRENPAFQKDGKFSNDLYIATLRNMGVSPEYYGEQMRAGLMSSSVSEPLLRLASVPLDYEVDFLTDIVGKVRYVDLYSLDLESVKKNVKADEAQVKAYYDDNTDKFKNPAVSRFNYIVLDMSKLVSEVKADDAALEEYYNLHIDDYAEPEKRGAYHLEIKKGSDNEKNINAIASELKSGRSFSEVASKYSLSTDVDMGLVGAGTIAGNLEQALFALEKTGDVSDAIVDDNATHFVGLYKIKPQGTASFADVKAKVRSDYINEEARKIFNEKSQVLTDLSFENPDSLDATADALKLKIMDSGSFVYGDDKAPWPLNTQAMRDAAFNDENINSHMNSSVINISDSVAAVINVYDYTPSTLKAFDDVKDEAYELALKSLTEEKGNEILKLYASDLTQNGRAIAPDGVVINKRGNVRIARGDNTYDPSFGMAIYAIENTKGAYTIDKNKNVPTLAVLLEEKADDGFDKNMYHNALNMQMMQLNSQKGALMLRQGARELNKIVYNQEAIDLVIKSSDAE